VADLIDSDAAGWVARLDQEPGCPVVRAELERWLEADRRHRGAFLRAQAAWAAMDRARVLPMPVSRSGVPTRRLVIGGGLAVGAAAAGVAVAPMLNVRKQIYETGLREIRRVQFEDSSIAAINSETTLEVSMGPRLRRVRLLRGDAWFQVAKDKDRPFLVETDRMQVRAVGTAFAVAADGRASTVLVSEGVVAVGPVGRKADPEMLHAGLKGEMAGDGLLVKASIPMESINRTLAWRETQIALDGETLGQAVAQFNRYNLRKLVVVEPGLADRKLVGWFWMNDPESFARAAAVSLGIEVSIQPDRIILSERRQTPT
jgi:transmembrane sensor